MITEEKMHLSEKNDRNIGIELLRIISMIMIVTLHCFNVGGILDNVIPFSLNYYISNFIFVAVFGAVNLYALTTGYLCIKSKHRYTRIVNLWIEVIFYSVLITFLFYLIPGYDVNKSNLLFCFFPLLNNRYWYFTAYFLLFLLIPFINKGLLNIDKRYFKKMLFFLFFMTSIIQFICSGIGFFTLDTYYLNSGISFLWIFIVYIFGAYIRLYGINNSKNIRNLFVYVVCTIATFLCFVIKGLISYRINLFSDFQIVTYSFPFIFIGSLFLFKFFINLRISKGRKFIAKVSSVTFSVYLISVHPCFAFIFEKDFFKGYANSNIFVLLGYVFLFVIITYVVCTCFAVFVKWLFEKFNVYKLSPFIVSKIRALYYQICRIIHI